MLYLQLTINSLFYNFLMGKSKKLATIKDTNCLNCGFPFSGQENFCPECGQKNKGDQLTFGSFMSEVFNGFTSWDAKFWTTIIPLLTKPGKVSLDYVEGKRSRYTNPFRFYLTVSIIFFLIIGLSNSYQNLKKLSEVSKITTVENTKKDINLDSIQDVVLDEIEDVKKDIDSVKKKNGIIEIGLPKNSDNIQFKIARFDITPFMKFQKKHPKMELDQALDSLKKQKNFTNRFLYKRAEAVNSLFAKKGAGKDLLNEIIGNTSIALFVLLPVFTLFLKLLYIRRKKTYVSHLVFVFHTQTVFFLLLTLFFIINFTKQVGESFLNIFLLLFLLYLFLAMKKFYKQGYFKTFVKFIIANMLFVFLSIFGGMIVSVIAFLVF